MVKLKIAVLPDDKPVKIALELPASVHRDLIAYAEALARETGQRIPDPSKLVAPMLARFMATDRAFAKARRKPTAVLLRRHLDQVQRRARHEVEADPRPSPRLWFLDDVGERRRRPDPSKGDAGDPDDRGRTRRLDARSVG